MAKCMSHAFAKPLLHPRVKIVIKNAIISQPLRAYLIRLHRVSRFYKTAAELARVMADGGTGPSVTGLRLTSGL